MRTLTRPFDLSGGCYLNPCRPQLSHSPGHVRIAIHEIRSTQHLSLRVSVASNQSSAYGAHCRTVSSSPCG
jgi:hypothetical protein